ncbi:DUF3630 family protein [Alteromonas sp. C1M14]|uniref:DUF3630 family protein n=1 Tax=Alteromonas sp. C1M14 TaxID=2841567 RepID=UPI001C07F14A|nr:DUF3630 family protein [Alteromonas sp. C1M14]MBU2980064.1 DUF3630 family protein [Alteromonas sp. C1M14]
MQQLSNEQLCQACALTGSTVTLNLSLPETPLKAQRLTAEIARWLNAQVSEPDWGADRMQVLLRQEEKHVLLCIEWLCDAIWLEPVGKRCDIDVLCQWVGLPPVQ